MVKRSWPIFALSSLWLLLSLPAAAQINYILEAKPGTSIDSLVSAYQFTVVKSWTSDSAVGFKVSAPSALSSTSIAAIRAQTGVLDVELDATIRDTESDSGSKAKAALQALDSSAFDATSVNYFGNTVRFGYVNQPATSIVELGAAQQLLGTGTGIIAIVDTGVDPNHPALQNALLPGYDFTRDLSGTADEFSDLDQSTVAILDQSTVAILDSKIYPVTLNQSTVAILDQSTVAILDGGNLPAAFGHGTMVAGLVHLAAPNALILPLKAFHADGSASLSDIVRAIRYAADYGASVISMSFTFSTASPDLQAAIQYANSKGAICVASAGNNGSERTYYPAGFSQVIGVGSTNFSDIRSPFSNYDDAARTSAPGEALVTTYPGNNYAGVWGTSFSTAFVSGAIALCRQANPSASFGFLQDAIDAGPHIRQDMGDARLDLEKTLVFCLHPHD